MLTFQRRGTHTSSVRASAAPDSRSPECSRPWSNWHVLQSSIKGWVGLFLLLCLPGPGVLAWENYLSCCPAGPPASGLQLQTPWPALPGELQGWGRGRRAQPARGQEQVCRSGFGALPQTGDD